MVVRIQERVLVVMPAHDEAESLPGVLDELEALDQGHDLLVVDDGSEDATAQVLAGRGVRRLRLCARLGYGGAVQAGFRFAAARGYAFVVQMDADGQHDPAAIPDLLAPVLAGEADLALGSRFLGGDGYPIPRARRLGMAWLSWVLSRVVGRKLTDATSGFQAMSCEVAAFLGGDRYPVDYPDTDVLMALHYARFRIVEVPAAMRPRRKGRSLHEGPARGLYYLLRSSLAILAVLLRRILG